MEPRDYDELKQYTNHLFDEVKRLRAALEKIANKETCAELYPPHQKYVNHYEGWEGVAKFARLTLDTRP